MFEKFQPLKKKVDVSPGVSQRTDLKEIWILAAPIVALKDDEMKRRDAVGEIPKNHLLDGSPRDAFIFRAYNPYIGGSKPSFFMGFLGSNGGMC